MWVTCWISDAAGCAAMRCHDHLIQSSKIQDPPNTRGTFQNGFALCSVLFEVKSSCHIRLSPKDQVCKIYLGKQQHFPSLNWGMLALSVGSMLNELLESFHRSHLQPGEATVAVLSVLSACTAEYCLSYTLKPKRTFCICDWLALHLRSENKDVDIYFIYVYLSICRYTLPTWHGHWQQESGIQWKQ